MLYICARVLGSKYKFFIKAGGLFGKIKEVKSDSFIIEIAENTRVRIAKDSVYPSAAEAKDSGADQAK